MTDPFEKHVTRTMDALKKSVERAGCTMDSIIHLQVFLCLPLAETPAPTGRARFDAHKAQYDALNKIYGTYFSPGKAPSRACMAVEWIPGDSLIEIVGSARNVNPPNQLRIDSSRQVAGELHMNLKFGSNRRSFLAAVGAMWGGLVAPAELNGAGMFGKKSQAFQPPVDGGPIVPITRDLARPEISTLSWESHLSSTSTERSPLSVGR